MLPAWAVPSMAAVLMVRSKPKRVLAVVVVVTSINVVMETLERGGQVERGNYKINSLMRANAIYFFALHAFARTMRASHSPSLWLA